MGIIDSTLSHTKLFNMTVFKSKKKEMLSILRKSFSISTDISNVCNLKAITNKNIKYITQISNQLSDLKQLIKLNHFDKCYTKYDSSCVCVHPSIFLFNTEFQEINKNLEKFLNLIDHLSKIIDDKLISFTEITTKQLDTISLDTISLDKSILTQYTELLFLLMKQINDFNAYDTVESIFNNAF